MLAEHFLDAERRGLGGHGLSRIEWLETWDELPTDASPLRVTDEPGYQHWDGGGALGYLTLAAGVEGRTAPPPVPARAVGFRQTLAPGPRARGRLQQHLPDGLSGLLGAQARRRRPRRAPDGHLAASALASGRRAAAGGHEPARDCGAVERRQADGGGRVDGVCHLRRRAGGARAPGGARAVRRRPRTQVLRARDRAAPRGRRTRADQGPRRGPRGREARGRPGA